MGGRGVQIPYDSRTPKVEGGPRRTQDRTSELVCVYGSRDYASP